MTGNEALRRMSEIKADESRKLTDLAKHIETDVRQPIGEVLGMADQGEESGRRKAEKILVGLGELAVRPLLSADRATGERGLKSAALACQATLDAQRRVIERLHLLMQSKSPMPKPPLAGRTEEKESPSRECDEAYLLARWLLKPDESDLVQTLHRKPFLRKTEAQRDALIADYQNKGRWGEIITADDAPPRGKR